MKVLIKSALIGCTLGTLPAWPWYRLGNTVQAGVGLLMLPGLLVAVVFSGGWLHDVNFGLTIGVSCAFYTALSYAFFRMRKSGR
ncbi:MAG TPA: hypothetical protein VNY05_07255 [Candidatus Acidoferrales bacterium]|jgi:hypothetical protein|nr:hypothetical protein [Candidatus Acidoferrales bacterium]